MDGQRLRLLNDKSGLVTAAGAWGPVSFSPDGRRLLTVGEDPNTTWRPGGGSNTEASTIRKISLKVWDVSSGQLLKVLPGPSWGVNGFASVAWVRTSTGRDGKFEPRYIGEHDKVCQLPDRTLGVQIGGRWQLKIRDLTTNQLIQDNLFGSIILITALSPDGTLVASGGAGSPCMIKVWRVADGKLLAEFEGKGGTARAIAFSRDGKKLVVVGGSDTDGIASVYAL